MKKTRRVLAQCAAQSLDPGERLIVEGVSGRVWVGLGWVGLDLVGRK